MNFSKNKRHRLCATFFIINLEERTLPGIGKEIAITFATAGASVVVSDINADAANHVVDEIQQLGGQAFACRCDITSEQELSALADFAVSKLGKVDILVNNAGGGGPKPFDMPMADFRRAYELNVFSFFHLSQLVAPEMEKNGGGVILTTTDAPAVANVMAISLPIPAPAPVMMAHFPSSLRLSELNT